MINAYYLTVSVVQEAVMPVLDTGIHVWRARTSGWPGLGPAMTLWR